MSGRQWKEEHPKMDGGGGGDGNFPPNWRRLPLKYLSVNIVKLC
jgi:hypothetical protein